MKPEKGKGFPNKHLHARATFLYQAATYLAFQGLPPKAGGLTAPNEDNAEKYDELADSVSTDPIDKTESTQIKSKEDGSANRKTSPGIAVQLGSQLRGVTLKGQIRLSSTIKRSLCKGCNAILIPGQSCSTFIENKSRGGKKPWADVLVTECNTCGTKKRFPVGSIKQIGKATRASAAAKKPINNTDPGETSTLPTTPGLHTMSAPFGQTNKQPGTPAE